MKRFLSLIIPLLVLLISEVYAECEFTQLPSSLVSLIQGADQAGWDARNLSANCDLSRGLFRFQSKVRDSVSNSEWHIYCTDLQGNWLHVIDQSSSSGCGN